MQLDENGEVAACLVVICGALDRNWTDYLGSLNALTFAGENQGVMTMLSGPIVDFAAFVGLIQRLQNLGLPVQSISFQRLPSRQPV